MAGHRSPPYRTAATAQAGAGSGLSEGTTAHGQGCPRHNDKPEGLWGMMVTRVEH